MPDTSQALGDFEFTFESYPDSTQIEPDSLSDSISMFHKQFGRTYHSYRAGSYVYPNDPTEAERQEEQYEMTKMAMDGQIHLAPYSRANPPKKVLDIATGTGAWAIDLGDKFPEAEIIGTDLSPIQPTFVPPNVRFFVEDSGEKWEYLEDFDYIHTRYTLGCWENMKDQIIQQAFDHLEPGGWLECQEIVMVPFCDDGTMPNDYSWRRWAHDCMAASSIAKRQLDLGPQLRGWLHEVGFVDIHEAVVKLPIGNWPKDLRLKHVGMMWQRCLDSGLSGFTLGLFHHFLGRTVEEIEVSLVDTRNSIFDRKIHAYHKFHVVWGRKPEAA
ncbi:S-adenosyl-L-methionine-dependent methyltransferase [Lasiosphaeris hirsuta]|uniref:S-adenosyl-L-methionine-dependent methyltransferase n=1 Tax=Lasiosphaeris hirsuta TaxID=260670 RepID=A0AA40APK3_9PEZI|nr:S-adenosyl-L-methionine-dependent methyltransferase [Lasiosphaeris hirsuta]